MSLPLPVPAGHIRVQLRFRHPAVQVQSNLPCSINGFQTDMVRYPTQHGLHTCFGLPHKTQRPCGYGLCFCCLILLLRHDFQNQWIENSKIQIFRPAEDHPANSDVFRCFQAHRWPAAKRLRKKRIQRTAAVVNQICFQLICLFLRCSIGRFSGTVEAVKADRINIKFFFQQRDHIFKLPPAHQISVQQHDLFPFWVTKPFDFHFAFPLTAAVRFPQESERTPPSPRFRTAISFACLLSRCTASDPLSPGSPMPWCVPPNSRRCQAG